MSNKINYRCGYPLPWRAERQFVIASDGRTVAKVNDMPIVAEFIASLANGSQPVVEYCMEENKEIDRLRTALDDIRRASEDWIILSDNRGWIAGRVRSALGVEGFPIEFEGW